MFEHDTVPDAVCVTAEDEIDVNDRFSLWFGGQSKCPKWQSLHTPQKQSFKIIPSSVVANIIGVGYQSIFQEWRRYTNRVDAQQKLEGWWLDWGVTYEPVAISTYLGLTNSVGVQPGSIRHRYHKWLWASCDQILLRNRRELSLLEIKCPQKLPVEWRTDAQVWRKICKHVVQVQMQMACTEIKHAYLFYYHPNDGHVELIIPYMPELVSHCISCCEQFLRRVETDDAIYTKRNPFTQITVELMSSCKQKILEGMSYINKHKGTQQDGDDYVLRQMQIGSDGDDPPRKTQRL